MSATYQISPQLACIFVKLDGTVTDSELIAAQSAMFSDPLFQGHYARLIDGTEVTSLDVTSLTVRYVARSAEHRGMRKAALVASSDHIFALMRMYESYASDAECGVFRNLNEARAWLFNRQPEM